MDKIIENSDVEWANKKFNKNNNGATYTYYSEDSRVYITYMYGKTKLQLLIYNIILYFRYIRRKNDKNKRNLL